MTKPQLKSSLRLKPKTPLEKDEVHKINTILMHLNNHSDSFDFRQPVDYMALELFDYPQIVKNPMDLGTVTRKFRNKKYKTVESVLNQVQLVWDNCKLYNHKSSDIYQLADKLQLNFRKMIKNYLPHLKVSTVTSCPTQPVNDAPFEVVYLPERQNASTVFEKKRAFLEKLGTLSQNDLEKMINHIQKLVPKTFREMGNQWATIDFQNVDNSALVILNRYFRVDLSYLDDILRQNYVKQKTYRPTEY